MTLADPLYINATLRDRFVAAASAEDETVAQRLQAFIGDGESPTQQRDDAWRLLTAGVLWANRILSNADLAEIPVMPVDNSESAFAAAQQLEQRLFELSQLRDRHHDQEALIIDSVKRACYAGAELGPVPGGRLAVPGSVVTTIAPDEEDLRQVGSALGEALRRVNRLMPGDAVAEAARALSSAPNKLAT